MQIRSILALALLMAAVLAADITRTTSVGYMNIVNKACRNCKVPTVFDFPVFGSYVAAINIEGLVENKIISATLSSNFSSCIEPSKLSMRYSVTSPDYVLTPGANYCGDSRCPDSVYPTEDIYVKFTDRCAADVDVTQLLKRNLAAGAKQFAFQPNAGSTSQECQGVLGAGGNVTCYAAIPYDGFILTIKTLDEGTVAPTTTTVSPTSGTSTPTATPVPPTATNPAHCWTCPAGMVHWYDVAGMTAPDDVCACVMAAQGTTNVPVSTENLSGDNNARASSSATRVVFGLLNVALIVAMFL